MAKVQKYFEQFHETIRIDYELAEPLRNKRDILLEKIRVYLKENGKPTFDRLLQGSYAMRTGVAPIEKLEYDIDVGLRFDLRPDEHTATEVRGWVLKAVEGHTKEVKDKGPCIRVVYADGYHVDIVTYAWWSDTAGKEQFRLAHKSNGWRPADPPALLEAVDKAREPFAETEDAATKTDQFRRVVRYLRRWDDEAIPRESTAKPTGLAFVLLCASKLTPRVFVGGDPDDRWATELIAKSAASAPGRLTASKPTPEYEEMFSRLTDEEMGALKARFATLTHALEKADAEPDPVEACRVLQAQFGRDFPVPPPEDTGKKTRAPAIVTSSSSASGKHRP